MGESGLLFSRCPVSSRTNSGFLAYKSASFAAPFVGEHAIVVVLTRLALVGDGTQQDMIRRLRSLDLVRVHLDALPICGRRLSRHAVGTHARRVIGRSVLAACDAVNPRYAVCGVDHSSVTVADAGEQSLASVNVIPLGHSSVVFVLSKML